jgi:hypothetical protein
LVGNAVKFTEKGSVGIVANVSNYDEQNKTLDLVFEVKDTGIGIPEDQQLSIFEPFKQKDGQINKKYGGTGLGLSISSRLVDMMGGSITLQSQVNKGSTFTVTLPKLPISDTFDTVNPAQNNPSMSSSTLNKKNAVPTQQDTPLDSLQPVSAEMLMQLEQLHTQLWLDCTTSNRVSDIKKLASLLLDIGAKYNHAETIQYASAIQQAINHFDLKNTRKILEQYPKMLTQYQLHCTEGGPNND